VGLADIIVLAVKPQNMAVVLDEISGVITADKTVVSIAAGITLAFLQSRLKTERLIRVMPNTPALVQEGMSVISLCSCLPANIIAPVRDIFISIGKVLTLPEKHMDAVTALSGSGPGFVALFTEAMIESGEKMGLTRDNASELAVQTVIGTAKLLETGMPPENLRKMVTSPGGTTAAGVKVFEEKGLVTLVTQALGAAKKRAEELASA
jgi:pyrroline-5-carboxylate reductase